MSVNKEDSQVFKMEGIKGDGPIDKVMNFCAKYKVTPPIVDSVGNPGHWVLSTSFQGQEFRKDGAEKKATRKILFEEILNFLNEGGAVGLPGPALTKRNRGTKGSEVSINIINEHVNYHKIFSEEH